MSDSDGMTHTNMMHTGSHRRVAIVGTAQSWTQTPWTDTSLEIHSLNDAYRLPGFLRADQWFDFHPINRFHFSDGRTPILPHQIPSGYYVRPETHLPWLAAQQIPIVLHPEFRTQTHDERSPEQDEHRARVIASPMAQPFPRAAIEEHFGIYETSSPAWMMLKAMLEGVQEIHVYGIHLATEFEYMRQRPNFEHVMGMFLGRGKRTMTVKDDLRYYETPDALLVLPESSPILQEKFQYAFDPRPDQALDPLKWELHKIQIKKQRLTSALMSSNWPIVSVQQIDEAGSTWTYRRRGSVRSELIYLDALAADYHDQLSRAEPIGA